MFDLNIKDNSNLVRWQQEQSSSVYGVLRHIFFFLIHFACGANISLILNITVLTFMITIRIKLGSDLRDAHAI